MRQRPFDRNWTPGYLEGSYFKDRWKKQRDDVTLIRILAYAGDTEVAAHALSLILNKEIAPEVRLQLIPVITEIQEPGLSEKLLALIVGSEPEAIQLAAIQAIQSGDGIALARTLIERYPTFTATPKSRTRATLLS